MKRYFVLAFLLVTLFPTNAEASTLFGRVIDVNDGDVITVFNLNRPVRIKLLGVDAPEAGQAFGDLAKKHLADLVYDRSVLVEYSGIAADGSLVGRVMLDSTDVGAQMIRDGAAWFDASNQERLSVAEREVYQQSEQAARRERRGLWGAENPIAPWEFVRAQTLKRSPAASLNSILPAAKGRANGQIPELTSIMLLATGKGVSSVANRIDSVPSSDHSTRGAVGAPWAEAERKNWRQFKPAGENFSALMPDDGREAKISVPFEDEQFHVNVYVARDGWAMYGVMWITGPTFGESDRAAIEGTVQEFLKGFGAGYEKNNNSAFSCELGDERRFSLSGYSASEFDLPSCTVPAKVRAYTRVTGRERQMYIAAVFYPEEDANVSRFMNSFTVGAPRHRARTPKR